MALFTGFCFAWHTLYSWKLLRKAIGVVVVLVLFCVFCYPSDENESSTCTNYAEVNDVCQQNHSIIKTFSSYHCFKDTPIFFVETSGSSILNARQSCAIESTAHHNPSFQIIVLMASINPINYSHHLMDNLKNISNVNILRINFNNFLCDTPIWKWYSSGKWKNSQWKVSHLSDALRFFLIWKYGGIYLDMDIVTLRSLKHLKNAAVTENWDRIAAGILFFDRGHELIRRCMVDFAEHYDSANFVANGPGIITRNIKTFCGIENVGKVSGSDCNIDILPPEAAFPIPYDEWEKYFVPSTFNQFNKSTFLIHVWNKYSKALTLKIGTNSLYEKAMKDNCVTVYNFSKIVGYA